MNNKNVARLITFFAITCLFLASGAKAAMCAVPASDGDQSISGVVNTYYEGASSASAGSTTITVGASSGAINPLAAGDLVIIMQMQDAQFNSANSSAYGSGGTSGRGYTALNQTGRYEFARVDSVVGSSVTLSEGLTYSYTNANATLTRGQRRFQVIKVPQYNNVNISGTVTAAPWDGRKGGVVAIDVANTLNGAGGTIDVSGLGFRGGAHRRTGFAADATSRFFYVDTEANNNSGTNLRHSSKGEGIAGTPQYVFDGTLVIDTNGLSNADGYPGGDYGRGAPGNAGGGGNEWSNAGNDSGGGGGANVSNGGNGGAGWNLDPATQNVGGLGGASFPASLSSIVMGGGGGAGLANNSGQPHGGAGGGIIIIRANIVVGSLTLNAAGADGVQSTQNDGGGGAGAGGSVALTATSGLGSVTVDISGGQGGDAWPVDSSANGMHGPGGGGGGGYLIYSPGAGTPSVNLSAGAGGTTTTRNEPHGATSGVAGSQSSAAGRYPCVADIQVTKSDTLGDYQPGATRTYSIAVTNNGPGDVIGASVTDTVPVGLNIDAISCAPVSNCSSLTTTGQNIEATVDVGLGETVTISVDVTYSTAPEDY
ncbi:DUF11 domain-containing protein [Kangiella spongicola]|uniref:DUF11 domain-containing protein n=1 Tax=Kangiella spongicola TaxID=796379 RepID=A0A318D5A2_9GAMM|nr:DUF11 domain-containing protein [Kangiella spongicola]PXF64512.1 hypothetical protein DL796_05060 [Kangiella spongicola]